jgi:hypothetical protein
MTDQVQKGQNTKNIKLSFRHLTTLIVYAWLFHSGLHFKEIMLASGTFLITSKANAAL